MKKTAFLIFNMQKHSVAFRLALKFSILVAGVILFFSTAFVLFLNKNVYNQQCEELKDHARQIIRQVQFISEHPLPPGKAKRQYPSDADPPSPGPLPGLGSEIPYYITFTVFKTPDTDADSGTDIAATAGKSSAAADNSTSSSTGSVIPPESIATNDPFLPRLPLTGGKVVRHYEKEYYIDGDLNILYYAEEIQTRRWGTVVVQTALNMDQDSNRHFLEGIIQIAFLSFVPLVFLSFAVVYLITKRTMKPVREITRASQKISSENLTEQLPVSGCGDEIDTLAQTFNDLFLRLKKDFDREKQFTSDVSHELKTPLAVILGHANLLRRWGKNDSVQLEKSLALLIDEVHSMEAIIENLLQISRLDSGRIKLNLEEVALSALCRRLEDDTKAWAPAADFVIDAAIKDCKIFTDKELFYQACTIIVSNSIKFFSAMPPASAVPTDAAGTASAAKKLCITFSAQKQTGDARMPLAVFSISDNGPGIASDVLPHIFERFYRGDPSHNRFAGGSGLGLSIVKSIMASLKGTVTAQSDGKSGTKLILTVPACAKK